MYLAAINSIASRRNTAARRENTTAAPEFIAFGG